MRHTRSNNTVKPKMTEKELQFILSEGEGYLVEFKESLSDSMARELVAFANSSGGRIFIGISDDVRIVGTKISNRIKSQIQDMANNCDPPIKLHLETVGKVLIVNVREGTDKPYKCSSGFYTRVGPNSQKLDRDEIIDFFKAEGKIRFDELVNHKFEYEKHFDPQKLDRFLRLAGISDVLDAPTTLVNLGVAEKQEGQLMLNNTGILFFSKNLRDIYYHTAVTCALYKGNEKVDVLDRRDFNEDIVSNIDGAMAFLKRYLAVRYEMTGGPRRKEIPEIPYDALREAVINAVAHRDYFERGSNVMVEVFDDRIEVSDFGGLPRGLKPEDFGKKSVLRNPNIADLLHRIDYIEKMGTGISKMQRLVAEAGLPPVEFAFTSFFTATFRRPAVKTRTDALAAGVIDGAVLDAINEGISEGLIEGITDGIKTRLAKELAYVHQNGVITRPVVEKLGEISTASAERDLSLLKKLRLLQLEGSRKTGRYTLTEKGKRLLEEKGR